jgi:hypothetical protein
MPQITLSAPQDQIDRIVEALCAAHGYEDIVVEGEGDVQSKKDFSGSVVKSILNDYVRKHEESEARKAVDMTVPPLTGVEIEEA